MPTLLARDDQSLRNGSFWKWSEFYGWSLYINGDYMNHDLPGADNGPDEPDRIWCCYTWKEALDYLPKSIL